MLPSLREACGVFGVYAPNEEVARITFFGIHALQHRGQESAGIATSNSRTLYLKTGMGLVSQVFDEDDLSYLPGTFAIGHTRYSTTGASRPDNAQPFRVSGPAGELALGHNGNIVNAAELREELLSQGVIFTTGSDSEVIAQLLVHAPGLDWKERWAYVMRKLNGSYSLAVITPDALMMARDPMGNRPLSLGRIDGGWVIASETCALDHLGAQVIRDVEPGEVIYIDPEGLQSFKPIEPQREAFCVFEYIYFARPDSLLDNKLVYPIRMNLGRELAKEHPAPANADVVIGVPDSATPAAIGYAQAVNLPFAEGLVKNRYVGRTFIQPDQRLREVGVRVKFNPLREVLQDRSVVLVDDSIVRSTTTPHVIQMLRKAGAREVHMRVTSPPISHPCFYGIDMGTRWELIASQKTVEEIREHIGADSLGYLSREGLVNAVQSSKDRLCMACFTGDYPTPVPLQMDKLAMEPADGALDRHAPEYTLPLRRV
ncbi:MAG TPA: amidophosphoribosyltransferase [Vicinamibacterales bacterium]|nr:amidophosphoribosyltransferase [Vicinamibacterales bacterium]